jgi:hypothetical protein
LHIKPVAKKQRNLAQTPDNVNYPNSSPNCCCVVGYFPFARYSGTITIPTRFSGLEANGSATMKRLGDTQEISPSASGNRFTL